MKIIVRLIQVYFQKVYYQSFIKKKNTKSKIITYQPKTSRNPAIVDITSVITEYPKT